MPVFLLALATLSARADVVFTDLSGGSVYNQSNAYAADGSTVGLVSTAAAFTASSTFDLSQIDVGIWNASGVDSVKISLLSDNSGAPGSVIESWTDTTLPTLSSLPQGGSPCCTLQTFTPTSTVVLNSGQQYWIEAQAIDPSTSDDWFFNDLPGSNPHFPTTTAGPVATNTGSGWSVNAATILPAFDVLGTPVSSAPEPSSISLLVIGAGVMAWKRRKRSANC